MTFKFTDEQQISIDTFIDFLADEKNKYMIIQGAAGSGKTTLIKHLVTVTEKHRQMCSLILKQKAGFSLLLAATTNPAAAVLQKITGTETVTVHSLLGLKMAPNFGTGKHDITLKRGAAKIHDSVIIIDEASMISGDLLSFIDSRTVNCKILLIGDQYQLAPVDEKITVLETLTVPKTTMNKVLRHSGIILQVATLFRDTVATGVFHSIPTDQPGLQTVDGPSFQQMVDKAFTTKNYTPQDCRILSWTNNRVLAYNSHVRKIRGQPDNLQVGETVFTNKPIMGRGNYIPIDTPVEITGAGTEFLWEDTNIPGRQYEINRISSNFLPNNPEDEKRYLNTLAKKKEWKKYFSIKEDWLDLRSPYASTVHKAQGSNYKTVFIDLVDIGKCFIASDVARMLYVAISRATEKVVFYGKLPYRYSGTVTTPELLEEVLCD